MAAAHVRGLKDLPGGRMREAQNSQARNGSQEDRHVNRERDILGRRR